MNWCVRQPQLRKGGMKTTFNDICDLLRRERKKIVDSQRYGAKEPPNSGRLGESFDYECVVDVLRKHILDRGAIVVGDVTIGLGTGRSSLVSTNALKLRNLLGRWRSEAMRDIGKEIHERWKRHNRMRLPESLVGGRKFQGFD